MTMVSKIVTAEDQFTEWLGIKEGALAVTGTFTATVTVQHKQQGTDTVTDLDTVTAAGLHLINNGGGELYRAGVKSGDFTSGPVNLTLNNGA